MPTTDAGDAGGGYPLGTVRALLGTDWVTRSTRDALQARLEAHHPRSGRFFHPEALVTLRAACARLVPQPHRENPIDIAGCIDDRLAGATGNGWRYDTMPADEEAYRTGLAGLNETARLRYGAPFHLLGSPHQDDVLGRVQRGEAEGKTWEMLPAPRFFEELLAESVEFYYSHPLAQEEIGYVGMADVTGWHALGLDQLESREPPAGNQAHA